MKDPLKKQVQSDTLQQIWRQFIAVVDPRAKVSKKSGGDEEWKQGGDMFRHGEQSVRAVYSE